MIRFLINTLLFYIIIIHNALSLFNEPKTYEKLYIYFGYSYQSITNNNYDYKQQNHNLLVGVGYNIYYKYNNIFDSFVGLQLETRIPVSPFFGKTQQHSFSNFMSFDMIFGAKFKINNDIALQPFFLFGFNVNHLKYNTTTMIKEMKMNEEKYNNDKKTYQNQKDIFDKQQKDALDEWNANNPKPDAEIDDLDTIGNWKNKRKIFANTQKEEMKIWEKNHRNPEEHEDEYLEETGRTIQGEEKENENKVGLDIGCGLDAILYDRYTIGMEYKYLSVQSGIETKIHQFSTKFGIMFNI